MDYKKIKSEHIKFILIESINDDIQGMYELFNSVKKVYPEFEIQNEAEFVSGKILSELIKENYVRILKITNPKFEKIESIENSIAQKIVLDKINWIEYQNDWIYGVESVNLEESIALENKLYEKLKTLNKTL